MKPYREQVWREYGDRIDPAGTIRDALALGLGLPEWKVADLLTDVRKLGRPSDPAPSAWAQEPPQPAPDVKDSALGQTVVTPDGDGLQVLHTDAEVNARIMNVDDLVAVAGIDLDRWEIAGHKVNTWSTVTKDDDGNPVVTRLWQVSATLRPRVVPVVRLDWPAPPAFVVPVTMAAEGLRRAVVLPDMQIGFRWVGLAEGSPWAEPYHDRAAIDVALQVLARVQPDDVILLGDNLDFQPLSTRWPFGDEARQTTQLAILEYRHLLWRIRGICPHARITYMLGNHEARLDRYLDERAGELRGITHADGRRALGLAEILGLDALQIETVPYPQPWWLWGRVEVEHGRMVRAGGGATAAALLARREHSVVQGHIHRRELAHRTVETARGPHEIFAASPGALCRTEPGIVPGADRPDWQQGIALITAMPDADDAIDLVRIAHGRAVFGGEVIEGRDYAAELAAAVGAPALLQPVSAREAA